MSASGILDSSNVVFYHNLDTSIETTQDQAWSGDPNFTPAKIGLGDSAIAPGDLSALFFDGIVPAGNRMGTAGGTTLKLSSTKIVSVNNRLNGLIGSNWFQESTIGTVVPGSGINFGTSVVSPIGISSNVRFHGTVLDSNTFVVVNGATSLAGKASIGQVSGTDITFGPATTWLAAGPSRFSLTTLNASGFICSMMDSDGSLFHGKTIIGQVTGTSVTYGPLSTFQASRIAESTVAVLDASTVVVVYRSDTDNTLRAKVGNISGNSISYTGSDFLVDSDIGTDTSIFVQAEMINATQFVVVYQKSGGEGRSKIGTLSGSTLSFGSATVFSTVSVIDFPPNLALVKLSTNVWAMHYKIFSAQFKTKLGKVEGDQLVWGTEQFTLFLSHIMQPIALDSDTYIVQGVKTGGGSQARIVDIVQDPSTLTATVPSAYPNASGLTKLVTALWTTNPTKSGSTVKIERDHAISLASGSVSLGSGAVWSGAGVQSLMSSLNDGVDHFLVADFENTGGTSWRLKTSLDSNSFVDQGIEAGEPVSVLVTSPSIELNNPLGLDSWVDELVLWAGNADSFTDQELLDLFALADRDGITMPKYEGNIQPPVPASGMLEESGVIFYHKLDNKKETTQSQKWEGSGVFVPGQVASGVTAPTSGTTTLTAELPGTYPNASGLGKIISRLWGKNVTKSGSIAEIKRDYKITLKSNQVLLGEGTAIWSGSNIESLMASGNDGQNHSFVFDFENTSGTSWKLQTSLDGAPLVDQGVEAGQAIVTITSVPSIIVTNASGVDSFVDEVILWAGNPSSFTDEELSNMHDLGLASSGTDQYNEAFPPAQPPTGPSGIPCSGIDLNADIDPTVVSGVNLTACSGSEVHKNTVLGNNDALDELVSVHKDVLMGDDVIIRKSTVIQKNVVLGNNIDIGTSGSVGHGTTIGNDANIGVSVEIAHNVVIEDNATIGNNNLIHHNTVIGNNLIMGDDNLIGKGVVIGKNVIIGNNVSLGKDVVIGDDVLIGDDVDIKKGTTIPATVTVGWSYLFHYSVSP